MSNFLKDVYQIEYLNSGIIQYKPLISHTEYIRRRDIDAEDHKSKLLKELGEYFTDESPLFKAITTGILDCNGQYPVKITKLH